MDHLVTPIAVKEARPFVERWHYSGSMPSGKNVCFAWEGDEQEDLFSNQPYAVAVYGMSASQNIHTSLARITGLPVTLDNLVELRRLCRIEPKGERQLTQFLSRCHKLLRKMGYRYVVSFSDPMHGHSGGIYKAANFTHLGKTASATHNIDEDGNIVHRRRPYKHKQRKGYPNGEEGMAMARRDLGLKKYTTPPKDRWFISL